MWYTWRAPSAYSHFSRGKVPGAPRTLALAMCGRAADPHLLLDFPLYPVFFSVSVCRGSALSAQVSRIASAAVCDRNRFSALPAETGSAVHNVMSAFQLLKTHPLLQRLNKRNIVALQQNLAYKK